jgi:hypothetical protein
MVKTEIAGGLLGAILWLPPWVAFCLGLGVRACLINGPHFPQFLWAYTAALSFGGIVTFWQIAVLLIIVGFAATFYFRLKPLVISALALTPFTFVTGYVVMSTGGCALVG